MHDPTAVVKEPVFDKVFNRYFVTAALISFLFFVNFNMVNPVVPKYAGLLSASKSLMGVAAGVLTITALLVRPITGPAADRFNKKKQIILSIAVCSVACVGYAFSHNLIVLIAFRILHGFGISMASTVVMTVATGFLPEQRMGEGIGIFGLMQAGGMAIAPYIGLLVQEKFGYSASFFLAGATTVVATLLAFALLDQDKNKPKQEHSKTKFSFDTFMARESLRPAVMGLLSMFAYAPMSAFVAVYGQERGIPHIGSFFLIYAGTMFVSRIVVSKHIDKVKSTVFVLPCGVCIILSLVLLYLAHSFGAIVASGILLGLGIGNIMPVMQAMCVKLAPVQKRGLASSTWFGCLDVSNGFAPIVGGTLAGSFGYGNMFLVLIVPIVAMIVLSFVWKRQLNGEAPQADA